MLLRKFSQHDIKNHRSSLSHTNILGNDAADQQEKLVRNEGKVDITVYMSTHEILNKIDEIIPLE